MNDPIRTFLHDQGLSDSEIRVYLDMHGHSHSFASRIAQRTGIHRTTVYAIIKRLKHMGVIAETQVSGTAAYFALAPDSFARRIENDIDELQAQHSAATRFAELLRALPTGGSLAAPRVQLYEGATGLQQLYQATLTPRGGQQRVFLTLQHIPPALRRFVTQDFMRHKREARVQSRVIVPASPAAETYKKLDASSDRQTCIVRALPLPLEAEIVLFGERSLAIIDFNAAMHGILIESDTLFRSLGGIFDYVWANEMP